MPRHQGVDNRGQKVPHQRKKNEFKRLDNILSQVDATAELNDRYLLLFI